MSYSEQFVKLEDIFLDPENPRHVPIDNEPEIIKELLAKEKVLPLAQDIAQKGMSPIEKLALIPHPTQKGKYIAAEGNRRICALKLLADPERAPTKKHIKEYEKIQPKSPILLTQEFPAVIFENRESANHWINLRHGGEQGGIGTRSWSAIQKIRFDEKIHTNTPEGKEKEKQKRRSKYTQALALFDYAKAKKLITEKDFDLKKPPITTVQRYTINPVLRFSLGLSNDIDAKHDDTDDIFDKTLKLFFIDLKEGVVNSRAAKKSVEKYASTLLDRKKELENKEASSSPADIGDFSEGGTDTGAGGTDAGGNSLGNSGRKERNSQHPDKRKYIVPSHFTLRTKDSRFRRIYGELKDIDPENFTYAGNYLFRAFLEKAAHLFATKRGKHDEIQGKKLHLVLGVCRDILVNEDKIPAQKVKILSQLSSKDNHFCSPDTLGSGVHGVLIPKAIDLKKSFDELEEVLNIMLKDID